MTATRFFCFSLALLPLSASQNILADEKPQLPKQYAEVVLHVEGMV
jgi:hypothetical protein